MDRARPSDDISVRLAWPDDTEGGGEAIEHRPDPSEAAAGEAARSWSSSPTATPAAVRGSSGAAPLVPELVPQFETLQSILSTIALRVDALVTAVSTLRGVVTDRMGEQGDQGGRLAATEAEIRHRRLQEEALAELRRQVGGGNDALRRIAAAIEEMSASIARVLDEVPGATEGLRQAEERQDQLARWLGSSLVHTRQQLAGRLDVIQALLVEGTGEHVEAGELPEAAADAPVFAGAVASLQEELAGRVQDVESLRRQATELSQLLRGGDGSLAAGLGQLAGLAEGAREREQSLAARVDQVTAMLQAVRERESRFEGGVAELTRLVGATDRREAGVVEQLRTLTSVVEAVGERERGLATRLGTLVEGASQREGQVEAKLAQLVAMVEAGRRREAGLEGELGRLASLVAGAGERQRGLEAKLDALVNLLEEASGEEVDLEAGLDELSTLVRAAGEREATMAPLLQQLAGLVESASQQETTVVPMLEDLQRLVEASAATSAHVEDELGELRTEVAALRRRTPVKAGSVPALKPAQIQEIARAVVLALDEPAPPPPPRPLRSR